VHALTKYMGGHGTTIGGVLVDSGKFPWAEHAERFPMLNEPDVSYHGVVYTEALGPAAYIGRARVVPLRNMGSAISPFNSFLILQGIETLPVRMDRHCENAVAVAEYLKDHPKVEWVRYAGLPDSPDYPLVQQYMDGGKASSILSFGIKGGAKRPARKFIDALASSRCGWSTSAMPRPWPAIRPPPPTASSPGRTRQRRRVRGPGAAVHRHRAHRRHHRRSRPGACGSGAHALDLPSLERKAGLQALLDAVLVACLLVESDRAAAVGGLLLFSFRHGAECKSGRAPAEALGAHLLLRGLRRPATIAGFSAGDYRCDGH
jgi:hypothetical protein